MISFLGLWFVAIVIGYMFADPLPTQSNFLQIMWGMMGWPGPDYLRTHVNSQHHEGWTP